MVDRLHIKILLDQGHSFRAIARSMDRGHNTIAYEVNVNGGVLGYNPVNANIYARTRKKDTRRMWSKIEHTPALREYIIAGLEKHWNPDEISGRMKRDHEPFYASKTAIYEWLRTVYGQRWCLYLYSRRYYARRRKGKTSKKRMIPHRIGIERRPRGSANRSRYGHYEGDTMVSGKKTGSTAALAVVYERKAKYLDARKISSLAPKKFIAGVNEMLDGANAKSISLDNGIENREHKQILTPAFFCDPYSSWQKGGVENGIKMIRRFIPKGVDLAPYSDDDVRYIIEILNGKPRKSLGYAMPKEIMVEQLFKNKKIPVGEIALRG